MSEDSAVPPHLGINAHELRTSRVLFLKSGSLELVGLRHCRLGDGAAQAVAEFIKSSKTIVEIGVDENGISDSGAEILAKALPQSTSLRRLYVGNNQMTQSGEGALQAAASGKVYFRR
eukprot:Skav236050  [mRNA]  locus=scaffold2566:23736:24770:+ [translate_table: standard]